MFLRFNRRHRTEVRGSGGRGHPHHLRAPGGHVCSRRAGGLPVGAAAGLRRATGAQHRGHPTQQQHARHGLGQAGGHRHPGHPGGAHSLLRHLQPAAVRALPALLHPSHALHHQHGSAAAHAARGLPSGEAVPPTVLRQDPTKDCQAQPAHGTLLCFRYYFGAAGQLAVIVREQLFFFILRAFC